MGTRKHPEYCFSTLKARVELDNKRICPTCTHVVLTTGLTAISKKKQWKNLLEKINQDHELNSFALFLSHSD
ncbi:Inter-Alpha-Trypsin Inhibitor Heavy Chain H3 [Manis pentadactyla]|nr:Inter-Alpha-Trypsin Inhibitor Heavy Chain H3 [Manis pentadactyla]